VIYKSEKKNVLKLSFKKNENKRRKGESGYLESHIINGMCYLYIHSH